MPSVKEILNNPVARYFKHPNSHKFCYIEIERVDNIPSHFITHHQHISHRERIDDRSYYDKSADERWEVLTQEEVDKINNAKGGDNVSRVQGVTGTATVINDVKIKDNVVTDLKDGSETVIDTQPKMGAL
jgi:hypothetical protein